MDVSQVLAAPSPAESHRKVQEKIEAGHRFLSLAIKEKMQFLWSLRDEQGRLHPEKFYKVITDQDLCRACMNGKPTEFHSVNDSIRRWRLIIHGIDTEGDDLVVMIKLSEDDDEPLEIEDFVIMQP